MAEKKYPYNLKNCNTTDYFNCDIHKATEDIFVKYVLKKRIIF